MIKKKDGFTLVEVLAVLVILAVMAAFTVPTMQGFVNRARARAYLPEMNVVREAVQSYLTEEYAKGTLDPIEANLELLSYPVDNPGSPLYELLKDSCTPGSEISGVGMNNKTGRLYSLTYSVDTFIIEIDYKTGVMKVSKRKYYN